MSLSESTCTGAHHIVVHVHGPTTSPSDSLPTDSPPTVAFGRYLDDIETQLKDTAPSYCLEYRGSLPADLFTRTVDILASAQPILRARITADDHGLLLRVRGGDRPAVVDLDGGERDLRREIALPWDAEQGVARFIHVRHASGGFVALRMDHAVHDGGLKMFLFRELWHILSRLADGRDVALPPGTSLPVPPSEILAKHYPAGRSRLAQPQARTYKRQALAAHERVVRLAQIDTKRLVAAARVHETSVHALVCGAILVAQRGRGGGPKIERMLCLSPVHLRDRVSPPVALPATTRFVGIHKAEVAVGPTADPVAVGREIKEQLEADIERGDLITDPIQQPLPWVESGLGTHIAHTSISNYGVIDEFDCPSGMTTTNFRTLSDMRTGIFPTYAVYTYESRLSIRAVFPTDFYTDDDVNLLISRMTAQLSNIGKARAAITLIAKTSGRNDVSSARRDRGTAGGRHHRTGDSGGTGRRNEPA